MEPFDPTEFCARWTAWYPHVNPLGYKMREAHRSRWLRIHSLPKSKRYPGSEAERATILERHNAVADAIVGGGRCVLLGYDYGGAYHLPAAHPLRVWLPDAPPVMRLAPEEAAHDTDATSVFAGCIAWHPGALDGWLLEVAEDQLRLILLNWDTGAAYAPYDGGADLFWPTVAERNLACSRFDAWLPARPDGL